MTRYLFRLPDGSLRFAFDDDAAGLADSLRAEYGLDGLWVCIERVEGVPLLICAWCEKDGRRAIKHGSAWFKGDRAQPLPEHTSHGICPACAAKQREERTQMSARKAVLA